MSGGEILSLPGCLLRFGSGFCIHTHEITHEIKGGRLWRIAGPAGCKREHVGIVDKIEV
ncbi:MAG: hypothetical protein A4E37_01649 [Methanoregulaceae archaeon PtaB.Bin056]|nr:MAG: hypothetical protein A4E37_01649 [Methanoregulaceae archaeon PtaB.Bin056]